MSFENTVKKKKAKRKARFFAKDFWRLMKEQEYKCALTGRELTPESTEVELRKPYADKGRTEYENHYVITRHIAYTARHVDEEQIVHLAAEIIKYRGKEFGYALRKSRR